jgi:hypothetical protein
MTEKNRGFKENFPLLILALSWQAFLIVNLIFNPNALGQDAFTPGRVKTKSAVPQREAKPAGKSLANSSEMESGPIAPPPHAKQQLRGTVGLASGLKYIANPIFILGADYARTIRPGVNIVAGLTRWSNTYSDPAFSIDFALTTIDAGLEYEIPITDELAVKGLARGGIALASSSTQESVLGELEKNNSSSTVFGLTVGGGGIWKSGNMEFGGEIRKPILFSDLAEGTSAVYLLATAAFTL